MEVLSKENKFIPLSATQIGKNCGLSTKAAIRYAKGLERKGLIEMEKKGRRWVFIPTYVAIKGFSDYFNSSKKGKKSDRRYSKKSTQPPSSQVSNIVNQSFEKCLSYQVFNAHRIILQFRLLRCDHTLLEKTFWTFGPKSIHKDFPEAFIFKSYDVQGQVINVLPKKPFIFNTYFEFEDQMRQFINLLIMRLKDYDIAIDLSQPAEIRLEHRAIEGDEFARKAVSKGLLYFESKSIVHGKNGELIKIVTKIDKSSAIHLEFEGENAAQFAWNYGNFVEDVATGRIDPNFLRQLPLQNETILANIQIMDKNTGRFSETITEYTRQIEAHIDSVKQLGDNAKEQSEATRELRTSVHEFKEEVTGVVCELAEAVKTLTNTVNSKIEDSEDIVETTIVYSARRAKIPVNIHKKSNLRHNKSKRNTLTFRYHPVPSGHYQLIPIKKGRIKRTRYIKLPFPVKKGTKLTWWLENKTICLKIHEKEVGSSER